MSNFVFLRAKTDWARSNIAQKIAKTAVSLVPYKPKYKAAFQLSPDVFALVMQPHDFLGMGEAAHKSDDSFTALSGFVQLPDADGRLAQIIDREISTANPADLIVRWAGEFTIGRYTKNGNEFVCFSDYSGLAPLYYLDSADFFAVSNRQFFLNPLCTRSEKLEADIAAMSSLISQGNKFGADSIIRGVTMIMPGQFVISRPDGYRIGAATTQLWESRGAPVAEDYRKAADNLVENFNWLGSLKSLKGQPIKISLTGGEDSRLVMSLALNSKLKDRVEAFTYGFDDNPDIEAAQNVAKAAGVPHEATIWKRGAAPPTIPVIWNDMRYHAFRFEGAPGAWDGGHGIARQTKLDLIGLYDFFYKRVRPSNAAIDVQDKQTFLKACRTFQQGYDTLGLLQPWAVQKEKDFESRWADEKLSQGAELNDLPDIYYQESRIPWWGGALNTNVNHRVRIAPLSNRFASIVGLKQSVKDRRERRFIFEVMQRIAPHLLEVPYLNKKWPDHFQQLAPHIKLPGVEWNPSQQTAPAADPWPKIFAKTGGLRLLHDFILENNLVELFDLIRRDRFEAVVNDPGLVRDTVALRSIINLAEMAILMAGKWAVEKDDIENHGLSERWETNLPEIEHEWGKKAVELSHGKRHVFKVDIEKDGVKAVRIDPMSKAGQLVIHRLVFIDGTGKKIDLLKESNRLRGNSHMSLEVLDGHGHFVSTGDDPHFIFSVDGAQSVEFDVTAFASDSVEVFLDTGSKFNRRDMLSRHLKA